MVDLDDNDGEDARGRKWGRGGEMHSDKNKSRANRLTVCCLWRSCHSLGEFEELDKVVRVNG